MVIDVLTGTQKNSLRSDARPIAGFPAISPGGRTCALGTSNKEVELWDIAAGTLQQSILSGVYGDGLSFSGDGNYLKTSQGSYRLISSELATSPDPELSPSILLKDDQW